MTMTELIDRFETESIGRPHIAQMMVEKGYVKQRQQAFDNFLGKGRKYYVDRAGADLSMASKAIKNSGGVPVHAHPLSLYLSINTLETTMEEIKAKGVMGLEAYHPARRRELEPQLEETRKILTEAGVNTNELAPIEMSIEEITSRIQRLQKRMDDLGAVKW